MLNRNKVSSIVPGYTRRRSDDQTLNLDLGMSKDKRKTHDIKEYRDLSVKQSGWNFCGSNQPSHQYTRVFEKKLDENEQQLGSQNIQYYEKFFSPFLDLGFFMELPD
jgi:hypothetical protein